MASTVEDLIRASGAAAKRSAAAIGAAKQVAATVAAARPIPPDPYPSEQQAAGTPMGGQR